MSGRLSVEICFESLHGSGYVCYVDVQMGYQTQRVVLADEDSVVLKVSSKGCHIRFKICIENIGMEPFRVDADAVVFKTQWLGLYTTEDRCTASLVTVAVAHESQQVTLSAGGAEQGDFLASDPGSGLVKFIYDIPSPVLEFIGLIVPLNSCR